MTERGHVHANLMRAPGFEPERQFARADQPLAHRVVRDRRLAVGANRVLQAVARIAPDRAANRALRIVGDAEHDAAVLALDVARLHRAPERAERLFRLRDDQQARRVAVEPVHEARAHALAGQRRDVREQRVHERAVRRAVRGMRDHAGGLVDHEQVVVFVDDVDCDRFGLGVERARRVDLVLETSPGSSSVLGLPGAPLTAHAPRAQRGRRRASASTP